MSRSFASLHRCTPAVMRHCMATKVVGGYSAVLRAFLRRLVFGTYGCSTAGLVLNLGSHGTRLIHARVTHLLADGEGLQVFFEWSGAASMKPCLRHYNILMKNSGVEDARFVEIGCSEAHRMRCYATADYVKLAEGLAEAKDRLIRIAHMGFVL